MSAPADWLTPEDVAGYLDLPGDPAADDNLLASTAAIKAAVEDRRSDLWIGDPAVFTPREQVRVGAFAWAALFYQARNAPSGFAGYGDETAIFDTLGARRAEIMRMVGWRRPEAI